jgi:anti-sigma factor RsiW
MLLSRAGASADDRLAEWVIAGHVRSLQVDHLTDVASSDQHTVKPWYRDKLDFSPQVLDLSTQGYSLSGGRLDFLADRPVAALVYQRRLHAINLFTWPAVNDQEKAVRRLSRQGFHIRFWQQAGMAYWAISDLNDQELDEFVRLFHEHSAESPT